jgi:hypothetical protein
MEGGYTIGASLSGSSSATSGISDSGKVSHGDRFAGGGMPKWVSLAIVAAVVVLGVVWLFRKN